MKNRMRILVLAALAGLAASAAGAACYADYKAKKDDPLRLHYGVAEVSECSRSTAEADLRPRLAERGWTLLNVVGVFREDGLAERKDSAGRFYLRF